jgi:RIO kinase 1
MTHESDLLATLEPFYDEALIDRVLYVVKSGKEATVYCCRAHPASGYDLIAAKIYRPRIHRTFSDDTAYQQGRFFHDKRMQRAAAARTRKGLAAMYSSWIQHEYETLHLLYHGGADIPRPIAQRGSAILMQYVGDEQGAAPLLARAELPRSDARRLFDRLIHNIGLWLAHDRVHGDLSPYNMLYWRGEIVVIDFPQAVHPQNNINAYDLLQRDVENVCRAWERYGVRANPQRIAQDLWVRYQFGEL